MTVTLVTFLLAAHRPARSQPRRGFTLLELIVVIVVLGVLSGTAIASYGAVTERSHDRAVTASLTAIARNAQALQGFESTGTWVPASLITSISETTAAASGGVVAAAPLEPVTGTVPGPGQVAYALSDDMTVAGLAMTSPTGNLCVVRAPLIGAITSTCVTATEAGTDPAQGAADGSFTPDPDDEEPEGPAPTPNVEVYAWGTNNYGQLGDGTTSSHDVAARVGGLLDGQQIVEVSSGANNSAAVTTEGTVYTWGDNRFGQVGDGTKTSRHTPVAVVGLPSGEQIVKVSVGGLHMVALTAEGAVYTWGSNTYGQLGDGTITARTAPVRVAGLLAGKQVTQVAAGNTHTVAVTTDGVVYAWGNNADGQLGDGTTLPRRNPTAVVGLPAGAKGAQVASTLFSTVALTTDGVVYAWGNNNYGQLGDGTITPRLTPVRVGGLLDSKQVASLATGWHHTLAITTDGDVYAWGNNADGQLGDGTTTAKRSPAQVVFPGGVKLSQVAAGQAHTASLTVDGYVYTWGTNTDGQLGADMAGPRLTPGPVGDPMTGVRAIQIAVGHNHTMVAAVAR